MSPSAPSSPLRQLLENRVSQLSSEVESLFTEARDRERREFADQLNQAVRRIRQSADVEELGATLVDAAGSFSTGTALFQVGSQVARGRRIRGVPEATAESFRSFEVPLASAAALADAVESRDPVIAVSAPAEVSAELVELAGHAEEGRVFVFPVVVRDGVPALVYAWGTVQGSAIELLTQVAAGVWSELSKPAAPELVQIAPASPGPPVPQGSSAWDRLSTGEQQVHFRAQRFARVQVAEMRLYQADVVQAGRAGGRLYEELRKPIDRARETFRQTYLSPCPSMVDYLHLELVRTLANDDPELLGKEYPGPMV
ncbi:MAG: hypothetical protein LAQ69_43080 [Acidobacteriia bacterium]|nr:hypothetical protein [Terriglobia bacterium]